MRVKTSELEVLFTKTISKLRELGIESVDLNMDNYWIIDADEWTDFESEKLDPSVGSLNEDWNSLVRVSEGKQVMSFVDFERLASILRAVGEQINPSK